MLYNSDKSAVLGDNKLKNVLFKMSELHMSGYQRRKIHDILLLFFFQTPVVHALAVVHKDPKMWPKPDV